jgi:hypothetical protein
MVAHPFTAYNLGRVSERSGDNELALKMFKAYLTLKPDAQDKEDVKNKIKSIEERIAAGTAIVSPETASGDEGGDKTAAPQEELAPPPEPKPAPVVQTTKPAQPEPEPEAPSHVVEWIVGGASAAALVVGVGLNLAARSKMSACQTDADKGSLASANTECDSARPLAYTSYALFSVAAAGAAVDAVLLILHRRGGESSSGDDSSVGFMMLPGGGGGLTARGKF